MRNCPNACLQAVGLLAALAGTLASGEAFTEPAIEPVAMTAPLAPPPVTGTTYHTATTGDDATGDGSLARPWRTIQHGMDQLQPGDRLYVRGGEYAEKNLTFARSGRADAYITVAGYPGEQARILGGGSIATFNLSAGDRWMPKREAEEAWLVVRDLRIDGQGNNNVFRIQGANRHHIWLVNNDIQGSSKQPMVQACDGAHRIVVSNNRIHHATKAGVLFNDGAYGSIMEWNEVEAVARDADDEGALKIMAPNCIARYNTVRDCYRSSESTSPGWAPANQGGKQWKFLQGVTGLYLDWAMSDEKHNVQPADTADRRPSYAYGNRVSGCNAGIYAWRSDGAEIFDNVVSGSGRHTQGGWIDGDKTKTWLTFGGPAGHGISIGYSRGVKAYRNVSFDNAKAGFWLFEANAAEVWDNATFANDVCQFHLRGGAGFTLGFNRILPSPKAVPAVRWQQKQVVDHPDFAAFRAAIPHVDEGSEVVAAVGDLPALARDGKLRRQPPITAEAWIAARDRLLAQAKAAGSKLPAEAVVPQAPYDPTKSLQQPLPWRVPGKLEFEDYDVGGPGVSCSDTTPENEGGHYRADAVDLKADPQASNGAVVGWTDAGEWLEYTIDVARPGRYRLEVVAATPHAGAVLRFDCAGAACGPAVKVAATGAWGVRASTIVPIDLPKAGVQVLRVTVEAGPVDLDVMRIVE